LIQGRQLLAEPSHGAVEIMEIELLDVVDAVIVDPVFAAVAEARPFGILVRGSSIASGFHCAPVAAE
jgi:hypothetical protein